MTHMELAQRIVDQLFTNFQGDRANRLVLVTVDGRDLGGWSERAMRDRVCEALREADAKREKEFESQ